MLTAVRQHFSIFKFNRQLKVESTLYQKYNLSVPQILEMRSKKAQNTPKI